MSQRLLRIDRGFKRRQGSQNCQVWPLSLGFHAKMSADFGKGNLFSPALTLPLQALLWSNGEVSTQDRLGLEFAVWVSDKY